MYVKVIHTCVIITPTPWGAVGNLSFHGLILMRGMPRKQYGQHVAEQGLVKPVPCQVPQAATQPQHNSHA